MTSHVTVTQVTKHNGGVIFVTVMVIKSYDTEKIIKDPKTDNII